MKSNFQPGDGRNGVNFAGVPPGFVVLGRLQRPLGGQDRRRAEPPEGGTTNRKSQSGVALVITLILLSVITFMAVTFLVISRRGSEQTTTFTQQVIARQAADSALQQVISRIISDMIARTNGFDFGLMVSTNYQSPFFIPGNTNITNVNYFTDINGLNPVSGVNLQRMLANQMILPRPPVFISTNKAFLPEFRFYLDLNRNGVFDPSGPVRVTNQFGLLETNYWGDPQWIGVLEHPDQPHSSSNRYIARYCFIAVPVGNSLDMNASHNHAKPTNSLPATVDGFLRDQGMGSWEINLAGFLNGLNPNYWVYGNGSAGAGYAGYDTNTPPVGSYFSSPGSAFVDANNILQYRYSGGYYSPNNTFLNLYGPNAAASFAQDGNDGYSVGPLMTSFQPPAPLDPDGVYIGTTPWSGADNPNHFYTSQDLFNIISAPNTFATRLQVAGLNINNYFDRYTYYRMLSQMGVDSAPEETGKLNLNYINVGGIAATNYIPWDALTNGMINGTPVTTAFPGATITDGGLAFFMNAVDRLLKSQPEFVNLSSTNIPIYPVNYYTPALHRLLQLAANIYDSTTIHPFDGNYTNDQLSYPSVFRPTFTNVVLFGVTNVIINGYTTNLDFTPPADVSTNGAANNNVYGIPWIIGARKGLPNLNQISMQGTFSVTRKLEIVKNPSNPTEHSLYHTNVQYVLGVSNTVAVQAWNSYARAYPRAVYIVCFNEIDLGLTNQNGPIALTPPLANRYTNFFTNTIPANAWAGFPGPSASPTNIAKSFRVVIDTTNTLLPSVIFHPAGNFTVNANVTSVPFDTTTGYPQPFYGFNLTNHVWFYMLDSATGRVIDYVQFNGMTSQQDLMSEIAGNGDNGDGGVWDTNRIDGSTNIAKEIWGIENQVQASMQNPPYSASDSPNPLTLADWQSAGVPNAASVNQAVTQFNAFYNGNDPGPKQVPYSPTRTASVYYSWQANDPLVHYTLNDLTPMGDLNVKNNGVTNFDKAIQDNVQQNLFQINSRYQPWAGLTARNPGPEMANYNVNIALIDPQITRSDDWQFPTNKFPNIGWLGRVHRGTPWQTVYMKSPLVDHDLWMNWTGNSLTRHPGFFVQDYDDSSVSQPVNDRALFDLFTTAPNDNATRGQLSVNQTGYAAWQALLAGVITVTNDPTNPNQPGNYGPWVIDPNLDGSNLVRIVSDLNATKTNYLGNVWVRVGDVLSTPSLTVNSPFVNTNVTDPGAFPNDLAFERIPQQIMSLLRVGEPRYVIYAYGQSLKPAAGSLVTGGPFFQLCTNYQITGEVATRTVVRFEPSAALKTFAPSTPFNPTRNPVMVGQKFTGQNQQPNPRSVIESFTVLPPE